MENQRLARFLLNNTVFGKIDERAEPYLKILGSEYCLRVINSISDGDNLEYLIVQVRPLNRDGETLFYRVGVLYDEEVLQCDYGGNLIEVNTDQKYAR